MSLFQRCLIIIAFALFFIVSYFILVHHVVSQGVVHSLLLPGEEKIPFFPWSFFIYCLVYVVPALAFLLLKTYESVLASVRAFFAAIAIHIIIWFFYPVEYCLRPSSLPQAPQPLMTWVDFMFRLDNPPVNCFPSLHVTYAFLTYFAIRTYRPKFAPYFLVLALLISLSTLTFKQHFVADVVAGFLVAWGLKLIFFKKGVKALAV